MKRILTILMVLPLVYLTSCSSDDDNNNDIIISPTGDLRTFQLGSVADPAIMGAATFIENTNGTTTIELQLSGTPNGGMHPAHIHFNTAAEGGDIALTLGTVDGATGFSSVTIDELNDGTNITYAELLNYDGYINVHVSADDLGTLVAQGDIGQNELTGTQKEYALGTLAVEGISGTATFSERVNGEALAVLDLVGTPDGGMHPAHIHANTAAEGGAILFTFNAVNGTTGMSKTNVASFDDGSTLSYANVLDFDGYINVHLSLDDLGTLVAQGDIGQNELTAENTTYDLATVDVAGISGTVSFTKRINGEALAIIALTGTPDGGMHPAHIHAGSVATAPGAIILTFSPINGTTGISKTNVTALNDDTDFNYDDVLTVDGYVNVHLSAEELGTLVAQGNVGANVN